MLAEIIFRLPTEDEARCQTCQRIVRKTNIYPIKVKTFLMIDSERTPVEQLKKVCIRCKRDHEKGE